ncbi:MAG: Spy/CpxP family protein refolding chaperone [Steroidobacteraceae bacterium]
MNHSTRFAIFAAVAALGVSAVSQAQAPSGPPSPPPNGANPPGFAWHHGPLQHRQPFRHHRMNRRGAHPTGLVGILLRQVRQLDLSSAQRQQMRRLLSTAMHERRSQAHPQLDVAVLGDPGNSGYARAIEHAKARAAQRIENQSKLATQIYHVLTPVQRKQVATLLAADQVRLDAMHEKMQQRRAEREQRQHGRSGSAPPAGPGPAPGASS